MGDPIRILCVDDERNVLKAIQRLFIDETYEILTARSGEEGLRILEQEAPVQLVIADFRMPDMDGIAFLQEVRARWPETLRMALSGYGDTPTLVEAINQGRIHRFIPKPWKDEELRAAVSEALHHRAASPRAAAGAGPAPDPAAGILEVLPAAVIGLDEAGRITFRNRRARELLNGGGPSAPHLERDALLPPALHRAADRILERRGGRMEVPWGACAIEVRGEPVGDGGPTGLVLLLIEKENHDRSGAVR